MAQQPPATIPLAFQERFCVTDHHVRCEMYKVAEDARVTLAEDSIPAEQVRSSRFRPTVRSRPVALEPSPAVTSDPPERSRPDRQVLVALGAAGAFALVLLVLAVMLGGRAGSPGPDGLRTPAPGEEVVATIAPERTLAPLVSPEGIVARPTLTAEPRPATLVRYEVQPGERLLAIADLFGTSRSAIVRANQDNAELGTVENPRDARAGDILIVPVSPDMSEAEIMELPGFVEFVEAEP